MTSYFSNTAVILEGQFWSARTEDSCSHPEEGCCHIADNNSQNSLFSVYSPCQSVVTLLFPLLICSHSHGYLISS